MPPPSEQVHKLHENLPLELKKALFSEETAETIDNACSQYGIEDERIGQVAKYVGAVLTGLLLPSEFEGALRKNVDLPEVLVKAISREINRFIFYPVQASLRQIHEKIGEQAPDIGVATPRHSDEKYQGGEYMAQPETPAPEQSQQQAPETPAVQEEKKADPYREEI